MIHEGSPTPEEYFYPDQTIRTKTIDEVIDMIERMKETTDYDSHPWKCFLLNKSSHQVFGVITENETTIGMQQLGNAGEGKLYAMGTTNVSKSVLRRIDFESTKNYQEAYSHLTNPQQPSPGSTSED